MPREKNLVINSSLCFMGLLEITAVVSQMIFSRNILEQWKYTVLTKIYWNTENHKFIHLDVVGETSVNICDSFRHHDAYMRQWIGSALDPVMTWHLLGAIPNCTLQSKHCWNLTSMQKLTLTSCKCVRIQTTRQLKVHVLNIICTYIFNFKQAVAFTCSNIQGHRMSIQYRKNVSGNALWPISWLSN